MTQPIEGPWIMGKMSAVGAGPSRIWRIPISGGGLAIASVWCGTVGREYMGMRDQGIAHARLIAAAPALLAALEALTKWGREHTSPRDPNSPHALLVAAVEAIAAATP